MNAYCTYLRVSTQRQGAQGLGISAQRTMCANFIQQNNGELVQEFIDVESGTHRDRKGLWDAIDYCKKNNCGLVIAKLDRLARDVEFTFKVLNTGIDIHFTDMPVVNSMILGVFAAVAQYEREMVSTRTKQALSAKKARGEATGGASRKWVETYNNKSKEQIEKEYMEKGKMKNERHLEKRDVKAFLMIIKNVFPKACTSDDARNWIWDDVTTKGDNRFHILSLMKTHKELDESGNLFAKWDFSDMDSKKLRIRLTSYIQSTRKSLTTNKMLNA